jgi:hypothetical protein
VARGDFRRIRSKSYRLSSESATGLLEWPTHLPVQSIAQVHRARLHTGEEVAVKVQRPDIRKHAKWDMLAFRILMRIYGKLALLPLTLFLISIYSSRECFRSAIIICFSVYLRSNRVRDAVRSRAQQYETNPGPRS